MSSFTFAPGADWVWHSGANRPYHNVVNFRREVEVRGRLREADLHVTADSRYVLYVNGAWVGHGPGRSWHDPWPVRHYDLRGMLREGRNVIAVTVRHFGLSTFQYLHAQAGLLAELRYADDRGERRLGTDDRWRSIVSEAYRWPVPRICCQMDWEEQYDARLELSDQNSRDWRDSEYDDSTWLPATVVRHPGEGEHRTFELQNTPHLTHEAIQPRRLLAIEPVRTAPHAWSINLRDLHHATDRTANVCTGSMLLATYVHTDQPQAIQLHTPADGGWGNFPWKLNNASLSFDDHTLQHTDSGVAHARLDAGINLLMVRWPAAIHLMQLTINMWTERPVRLTAKPDGDEDDAQWLALGPFEYRSTVSGAEAAAGRSRWVTAEKISLLATADRFEAIWRDGDLAHEDLEAPFSHPLKPDALPEVSVAGLCSGERVVNGGEPPRVDQPHALLQDNADWTTVHAQSNADVRMLMDFGDMTAGYQTLEIDAPQGTIIDIHNFEFIQRDGRINLNEGMHNSFRYICREGAQRYECLVRRGFRYSWMTLRNFDRPIRIRNLQTRVNTYPQQNGGSFDCSDARLTRIWDVGRHTVKCCSEDVYTDCTYEQTHWVGDARNEAMVDLVANGDPRISAHAWLQAARSLDRSSLVESHVPSGWQVVLPAWSFLWMRWAYEHFMLTGDHDFGRSALEWLDRNARGIESYLNDDGLLEIEAWNMFDWAPMDTPSRGIVTHQNCLCVLGLRETAALAELLGDIARATAWTELADRLSVAVNQCLWDHDREAYIDSIHDDGARSNVFSQQTQTAAYISDVAQGVRARRCRQLMQDPPDGFVRAGSPFFMFFLLEALARENDDRQLVTTIRDYWGKQIAAGATTFWEMYHEDEPRMTRSHCHGWSAAPTAFLTRHVLGVRPEEPGYAAIRIAPMPGNLAWARGRVPTPRGTIECRWEREGEATRIQATLPIHSRVIVELKGVDDVEPRLGLLEQKSELIKLGQVRVYCPDGKLDMVLQSLGTPA